MTDKVEPETVIELVRVGVPPWAVILALVAGAAITIAVLTKLGNDSDAIQATE